MVRLRFAIRLDYGVCGPTCDFVFNEWVMARTTYTPQSSDATIPALDTIIEEVGVCRDYAHLMIALCRALNLPSRFVTGLSYGAPPSMGALDFHAYVEIYLGGQWYIFDPTGTVLPMGLLRIGTGRDAADVSFATAFGPVTSTPPQVSIEAVGDLGGAYSLPFDQSSAISTAGDYLS